MSRTKSFQIENQISQLQIAHKALARFGRDWGLEDDVLFDLDLALEEVLTNLISYAYDNKTHSLIRVNMTRDKGTVIIEVIDTGHPFAPSQVEPPDLKNQFRTKKLGGLGLHLVNQLMDNVQYERTEEKNILKMTKRVET